MQNNPERLTVLVVEDSPTQANLMCLKLMHKGFNVKCATLLSETLNILDGPGVDVVLLDLFLPDSEGLATIQRVHNHTTNIPIVVLTGSTDNVESLAALQNGAQDYLIKGSVSDESIVRCLRYAVERQRIELKLWESERRTSLILENAYDAFISMNERGLITGWNTQAEKIFGWTRQDILGMSLIETIVPLKYRSAHSRAFRKFLLDGTGIAMNQRIQLVALHKDGHQFPIGLAIFSIVDRNSVTFCAFIQDITEKQRIEAKRKELNEELERCVLRRTAELERSNYDLKQFAKIASHDLQEPLRAIKGYARLLAKRYKGRLDKDADEFMEFITQGTDQMEQLIQGILTHSHIGSNNDTIETVDCSSVIDTVKSNLKVAIEESEAQITVVDRLPAVYSNRLRLLQLFQNLIGNAIKFRGTKPPIILIRAEQREKICLFCVEDNGIGIEPQYATQIFDMFTRLQSKTKYDGTGIGLAICKKIVDMSGGHIWVEPKSEGGSRFLFTLPIAQPLRGKENAQVY